MISKVQLGPDDLGGILAAVFQYNQRGVAVGVNVYDETGQPVRVGYLEVVCQVPGLKIRQQPEESPEDKLKRLAVGAEPVTDPHTVPGPQSLNDLAAAQEGL